VAGCLERPEIAGFDYGQVCMTFNTQQWYDFIRSNRYVSPGVVEPEKFFKLSFVGDYDIGDIKTPEFVSKSKSALGLTHVSDERFSHEFTANMRPDRRMLEAIKALKQNDIKLVMVSNMNSRHYWHTRLFFNEVFADFDCLMLSFQCGFKKPDRRMWEIPADMIGVPLKNWFYVDDLLGNVNVFEQLGGGTGHHYNVIDDKFIPNGRREIERNKLMLKMVDSGMLTLAQVGRIARIDFSQLE